MQTLLILHTLQLNQLEGINNTYYILLQLCKCLCEMRNLLRSKSRCAPKSCSFQNDELPWYCSWWMHSLISDNFCLPISKISGTIHAILDCFMRRSNFSTTTHPPTPPGTPGESLFFGAPVLLSLYFFLAPPYIITNFTLFRVPCPFLSHAFFLWPREWR